MLRMISGLLAMACNPFRKADPGRSPGRPDDFPTCHMCRYGLSERGENLWAGHPMGPRAPGPKDADRYIESRLRPMREENAKLRSRLAASQQRTALLTRHQEKLRRMAAIGGGGRVIELLEAQGRELAQPSGPDFWAAVGTPTGAFAQLQASLRGQQQATMALGANHHAAAGQGNALQHPLQFNSQAMNLMQQQMAMADPHSALRQAGRTVGEEVAQAGRPGG